MIKDMFKDDVFLGKRKYKINDNQDGTKDIEDVTEYQQIGTDFGAGSIINLVNAIYPIGIILEFNKNVDPNVAIGGVWERYGNGRVTVGQDGSQTEFSNVDKVGGDKTHQLSIAEMPAHTHVIWNRNYTVQQSTTSTTAANDKSAKTEPSGSTGSNQAHNNLQPYITVYRWVRTS